MTETIVTVEPHAGIAAEELQRDDWYAQAACRDAPSELFVFEEGTPELIALARSFCNRCPVKTECLDAELKHSQAKKSSFGIRGGELPTKRRKIKKQRRKQAKAPA